jgi:hypothetical protein
VISQSGPVRVAIFYVRWTAMQGGYDLEALLYAHACSGCGELECHDQPHKQVSVSPAPVA